MLEFSHFDYVDQKGVKIRQRTGRNRCLMLIKHGGEVPIEYDLADQVKIKSQIIRF